jgi:radical SAM protein with 4Fe4S-binding SPASM domain
VARLDIDEDLPACEKIFAGFWNKLPEEALTCGAGVFAFNINPYGVLSPCTMFRSFQYSLRELDFVDAWKAMVAEHDSRKHEFVSLECRSCSMLLICSNCPAWSEIEKKSFNKKVEYICDYAKALEKMFFKIKEGRKNVEKALSEAGN